MNETCPIDHEAAERAAQALPGPLRRGAYFAVGAGSVVMGVIGIFVPLWPTTCFLLLAGWCFARSSRRAERWLHENRLFGTYLKDYRERGVISAQVRTASLGVMWLFMGISAALLWRHLWAVAILALVGAAVTAHLVALPTAARETAAE
ncbi:MAG TPA: YbaN family protein [Longimicrobiales bacterium]|nr:YbaN family protein [Longimicrobiales bacterium]